VGEVIRRYRPFGVDVSSGVETDGIKDIKKIAEFIKNAKEAYEE
jgi:phosphoribosylanthranilate isomerase